MRKRSATVLLLTAILGVAPALAGESSATLNISVQVIARTLLSVDSQPPSVEITPSDIARGYVDVPEAISFHVRSNAANGYALEFQPIGYPFTKAAVSWGSSVATFGSDGTWLTHAYQPGTVNGTMSVRLILAPGTEPGSYAWPVSFAANSL